MNIIEDNHVVNKNEKIIATLGPQGTCSEVAAIFYGDRLSMKSKRILCKTFEEAVEMLKNEEADYAIIPSAYRNLAEVIFKNISEILVVDTFVLPTPNLVAARSRDSYPNQPIKKVATHASPIDLAKKYFKDADFVITTSNSMSARKLYEGEVDACLTTKICADQYEFEVLKDFGVISMGWNVFKKILDE